MMLLVLLPSYVWANMYVPLCDVYRSFIYNAAVWAAKIWQWVESSRVCVCRIGIVATRVARFVCRFPDGPNVRTNSSHVQA